jgi:hypothetical protein
MGGYGSGRTSYKRKAEHCRSLDVNRMQRDGCLREGSRGDWVWWCDGDEIGRIGHRFTGGQLVLNYRVRHNEADWEAITQYINLTQSDCNYGNTRPYFQCPGVLNGRRCKRRIAKLFLGGRYFLCRHCNNIRYSSQSDPRCDRLLRRANKLRMALGGEPGTAYWIAPKPKGMWQRTYQRKRREIEWCERQADQAFLSKYRHILSEEEQQMYFGK